VIVNLCAIPLLLIHPAACQEDIEGAIKQHFEKVTPELNRYGSRITLYGECLSKTRPPQEFVDQEVALVKQARAAGFTQKPSPLLFALCHNLLVYQPDDGRELLEEINQLELSADVRRYLTTATLAAGQWGEQFALRNLRSPELERRKFWMNHLTNFAIHEESIPNILELYEGEQDPAVRGGLLRSLATIGSLKPLQCVNGALGDSKDDDVQAAAIFTLVELLGFKSIDAIEQLNPIGPKAKAERIEALKWLKQQTSAERPFGMEVKNDIGFTKLYCDIKSPAMGWLNRNFNTYTNPSGVPDRFSADDKKELLDLLLDSKGFGLEAIKGSLFSSVGPEDVPTLLNIRAASWYSPNKYSQGRTKTVGILVRQVRKTAP
jgi:hypothetical protein